MPKQSEAWCKQAHKWTDKEIETVKILWAGDLTQAAIGKRFGVGKNSVHGLAKRLGLPPRDHLLAQRNPANCRGSTRANFNRMLPAILAVDKNVRERHESSTLMSHGERRENDPKPVKYSKEGCRYVLQEHTVGTSTVYCDHPAISGKSYCPEHHAVCVVKDSKDPVARTPRYTRWGRGSQILNLKRDVGEELPLLEYG